MKGFTLVEMLAVIIIIAFLSLITMPIVSNVINGSRSDASEIQNEKLIEKAKLYMSEFPDLVIFTTNVANITINNLVEKGYIDGDVKNPKTSKTYCGTSQIRITRSGNNYTYSLILTEC